MKTHLLYFRYYLISAVLSLGTPGLVSAYPTMAKQDPKGPWELLVKMGLEGSGLIFPISLEDGNRSQVLQTALPIVGTPIKIRLTRYCPALVWQETLVEDADSGPIASITVVGKDLKQQLYLVADTQERRSITSSIGGMAIRELKSRQQPEAVLKQLVEQKAIGVLSIWADPKKPEELVIGKQGSYTIAGSPYRVEVLDYLPHYSVDRETKKVMNRSDKPINPAVRIRLTDGKSTWEPWLWSNFPTPPHSSSAFPVKIEFNDFDPGPGGDRYFLVKNRSSETWMYFVRGNEGKVEKAELGKSYAFRDEAYFFVLDKIVAGGILKKVWKNQSETLENPALIASVEYDGTVSEEVFEIDQPSHNKTPYGVMVALFRAGKSTEP
jgi:hypothetical protein